MTRLLNHPPEMILAIAARSKRQISPRGSLTITLDEPCQRAGIETAFGSARLAGKRSLVFSVKFWRAECGPNPCPRPPANTHIPSNPPVLRDLSLQVRWPRSWHLASQRLISSSAATVFWSGSHSGMMTEAPPRVRSSTCRTPSFLAALITRFTSASVIAAGLPLIPDPFKYAHVIARREMRRYA